MKILIVSNFLPPKIGGIERISHELASSLNCIDGVQVSVATAKWPTKFVETEWGKIEYQYVVRYFPSITLFRRLPIPLIFLPKFWSQMQKLGRDFDLVFYQSHLFILNWIMAVRFRKVKRRVWMNQGCNYVPVNSAIGQLLSFFYERAGMAIMKRFSNEFIGQSENTARWIASKLRLPFKVLTNAINLAPFESQAYFDQKGVKNKVLFVGRLVEGKGLLECIDAVSKANQKLMKKGDPDLFTLDVVGSGPLKQKVINENYKVEISWLGEMNHSDVIKSMFNSDILIQAYTQPEGLTTVTLEGLAAGMLVVTTPLGGEGKFDTCSNYKSGSFDELPGLLLEARNDSDSRSQTIAKGRKFLKQGFTWNVVADRLIKRDYAES